MSWTDVFPVFTEEMVDDFHANATPADKALLEEWYGVEKVLNPQPHLPEIVSMSLFWKNVHEGSPELPTPTRETLQNAVELGLAERYNPWDHYVQPLLDLTPGLRERFPNTSIRVYLAKDLEFLSEELVAAGCEVYLMKSSSINFAPGGLWRFLPFEEEGKTVVVTDIDRLNELESDLLRTRTMAQAGVGAWRIPLALDLDKTSHEISYRPFLGCQFGVQGGLLNVRELLDAFTWQAGENKLVPNAIYPDCGPVPLQGHQWPSYGFDEYFLTVAAYPRLAQEGMLTFVPSGNSSSLLSLDIEYCTWGNPASELVYFSTGSCCGGEGLAAIQEREVVALDELPNPSEAPTTPRAAPETIKVALLFLTKGELNHPEVWQDYLKQAGDQIEVYAHVKEEELLSPDSLLKPRLIAEKVETEWAVPSLVAATLALLKAALADNENTHFILLSESCVPVKPFSELLYSLSLDPRSRTNHEPWSELRKRHILKAQRAEKIETLRPEIAYFQDQWMLLSREAAELASETSHLDSFQKVFAADECYFLTVLAHKGFSPRENVINRRLTWALWDTPEGHPRTHDQVSPEMVARISESGCFFARKFAPESNIGSYSLHQEVSQRTHPAEATHPPTPPRHIQMSETQDRAQVLYRQTSQGRSGHQLKDLFTSVILGELLNLETVFGSSWQKQSLLPNVPIQQPTTTQEIHLKIGRQAWEGIDFEEFQKIAQTIQEKRNDESLFVFSGVCRIHLSQLHTWEVEGKVPPGVLDRCLSILRTLYWGEEAPLPLRKGEVAIHARRGDVANPNHPEYNHMGPGAWPADFYQEKIDEIQQRFSPSRITLYSEKENSEDLQNLTGVTLDLGGTEELDRHFREMVTAEYFLPSCSSLSSWAAYLSLGTVLLPHQEIKHFDHPEPLPNWLHLEPFGAHF